jgi:hypothetical protein
VDITSPKLPQLRTPEARREVTFKFETFANKYNLTSINSVQSSLQELISVAVVAMKLNLRKSTEFTQLAGSFRETLF